MNETNEQMASSFDVKVNRKNDFLPDIQLFSWLCAFFFSAFALSLELSYVNEKVITKFFQKIILPVAHVWCQFAFKLLCRCIICPSLFYARLNQSELYLGVHTTCTRDEWNTTAAPCSHGSPILKRNIKLNLADKCAHFYHFHHFHDFIVFLLCFISPIRTEADFALANTKSTVDFLKIVRPFMFLYFFTHSGNSNGFPSQWYYLFGIIRKEFPVWHSLKTH